MSGDADVERLAKNHLRFAVRLSRSVPLPVGRIDVWVTVGRSPPRAAAYYASDGRPVRTNASWRTFERVLRTARIPLDDTPLLSTLLRYAPGWVLVATDECDVPEAYRRTAWRPARTENGGWSAHYRDALEGRWVRIEISPAYVVEREDLGPAPKSYLR